VYKHGTVYVVAGSAGQVNANSTNTYPLFYTRNQSKSNGGETGALYLEIQDNRLDARFVGSSGTVRDQFAIMKGVNKNNIVNTTVNKPAVLTASWIGGYNWYSTPGTVLAGAGKQRSFSVKPSEPGSFIYYVSDSLSPQTTCIADTFTLQVTSGMAISVTKFNALVKNKKVLVQWATTHEVNSDYFTVERSADGHYFEIAMVISGKGNTSAPTQYEFIDNTPLQETAYYRLTATDKNGDKKIVGIRSAGGQANKLLNAEPVTAPAGNNDVTTEIQSINEQILK
jgi:hypothetical protein